MPFAEPLAALLVLFPAFITVVVTANTGIENDVQSLAAG